MAQFSLNKEERILRKIEFAEIIQKGKRYETEHFQILVHENQLEKRRLGITVSKKVGKAVKRNRVKRLLREFFRLNKRELPPSCDFLFIAKPKAIELNYSGVFEELSGLFSSNGG